MKLNSLPPTQPPSLTRPALATKSAEPALPGDGFQSSSAPAPDLMPATSFKQKTANAGRTAALIAAGITCAVIPAVLAGTVGVWGGVAGVAAGTALANLLGVVPDSGDQEQRVLSTGITAAALAGGAAIASAVPEVGVAWVSMVGGLLGAAAAQEQGYLFGGGSK